MDVSHRIIERLAATTVIANARIDGGTEIYSDLKISGTDLYDFLVWVHAEFGTDFAGMKLSAYAPGEADFPHFHGNFESLTVDAILRAVAAGAWSHV